MAAGRVCYREGGNLLLALAADRMGSRTRKLEAQTGSRGTLLLTLTLSFKPKLAPPSLLAQSASLFAYRQLEATRWRPEVGQRARARPAKLNKTHEQ